MVRSTVRRAVLALAAGLVVVGTVATGAPSAGAVDGPVKAGNLQEAGKGVPASLKHGQTVYLTMYYRQESRDVMVPQSFGLSLFNLKAPSSGQMRGITATWWDPVTHRWENASHYDAEGGIEFYLPSAPALKVTSGVLAHVYVRITFGHAAFAGQWHFIPRVDSYSLLTAKGVGDWAYLDETSRKQYTSTLR